MSTVSLPAGYTGGMNGDGAEFGEWLQEQLERRELLQADFARSGNFNPQNVSRWINNERVPSSGSAIRIAKVFGIDEDLVLRVAGHKPPIGQKKPPRSLDDIIKELEAERPIAVPIIEQIASAGRGEAAIGYVYLPPMGRRSPGLFAMRVKGSCMVPRINDGDTIIVDREQPPELGKIVVAVAGDNWDIVLVKRLVEIDGRRWLQPLQGRPVLVDESVTIVGVVKKIISDA